MARKPVVLVTGANGEIGHGLIPRLTEGGRYDVLALDLKALDPDLARRSTATITGDILDHDLLERLTSEFEIHAIFPSPRSFPPAPSSHRIQPTGSTSRGRSTCSGSRWSKPAGTGGG